MLGKLLIFGLLWRITGNPFIAIIIILVVIYLLDRRYVGIFPSVAKPFRLNSRMSKLRNELRLSPHNTSAKQELARILIQRKKYREALTYLEPIASIMNHSADVKYELGLCYLKLGDLPKGEQYMLHAIELNPRVQYGEPFLRLGEAFASHQPDKAIVYLQKFREIQSSSCEAYYRMGQVYRQLGRTDDARNAFRETVSIYRSLPKYKRRTERRWALAAGLHKV